MLAAEDKLLAAAIDLPEDAHILCQRFDSVTEFSAAQAVEQARRTITRNHRSSSISDSLLPHTRHNFIQVFSISSLSGLEGKRQALRNLPLDGLAREYTHNVRFHFQLNNQT